MEEVVVARGAGLRPTAWSSHGVWGRDSGVGVLLHSANAAARLGTLRLRERMGSRGGGRGKEAGRGGGWDRGRVRMR